jgi:hypothetical protein
MRSRAIPVTLVLCIALASGGWLMERDLDELLSKVQSNATYQRLVVAQENYDKIMMKVNDWIVDGIKKGATSSIITLG